MEKRKNTGTSGFSNKPRIKKKPVKKGLVKKTEVLKSVVQQLSKKVKEKEDIQKNPLDVPKQEVTPKKKDIIPDIKHKTDFVCQNIPDSYFETRIVLMARDPYWLYAYWEVSSETIKRANQELGEDIGRSRTVLRVFDVTDIDFDGNNSHGYFDITLNGMANSWYLNAAKPNRSWCVEIAILTDNGRYLVLARSNTVKTPSDSISGIIDEEWMVTDQEYSEIFMREALISQRGSESISKIISKQLMSNISSESIGSLSSPALGVNQKNSFFWMRVGAEVIIYGAAMPDAKVKINQNPVKLRDDGTFSIRFALYDGEHPVIVTGESCGGNHKKSFRIDITKNTIEEL